MLVTDLIQDISNPYPSISIGIPTYNEANYIERVVRDFLSTTYPNLIEILIADGGSTDGTQEIIRKMSDTDPRIKLLDNHEKIQSFGLNLIVHECKGDILLRADAHSDYAIDYIEKCVEALLQSKACNVGGAQRFVGKTPFQAGVALASRSLLGNGGAKYRNPHYSGYADTVYLGCFWKKCLLVLNGYNVQSIANEDAELNKRLRDQFQNAIYIDSKIRVWYYPRANWKSLFMQYFKYGRGRCLTSLKHSQELQIRGKLSFIVLCIVSILIFIAIFVESFRLPVEELISFGIISLLLESLRITWKFNKNFNDEIWRGKTKKSPSFFHRWIYCCLTLMIMPISHFSGYSYQLFRYKVIKSKDW